VFGNWWWVYVLVTLLNCSSGARFSHLEVGVGKLKGWRTEEWRGGWVGMGGNGWEGGTHLLSSAAEAHRRWRGSRHRRSGDCWIRFPRPRLFHPAHGRARCRRIPGGWMRSPSCPANSCVHVARAPAFWLWTCPRLSLLGRRSLLTAPPPDPESDPVMAIWNTKKKC